MAQSAPTKGNLNAAKRSRALADNGYELMDRKRNILIREIMDLIDEAESLQQRIDSTFSEAYASMRLAEISMGGSAESGANVVPIDDSFSIRFRSVMGVELPVVNAGGALRPALRPRLHELRSGRRVLQVRGGQGPHPRAGRDGKLHLPPGLRHQKGAKAGKRPAKHRHPRPQRRDLPHLRRAGGKGARGIRAPEGRQGPGGPLK